MSHDHHSGEINHDTTEPDAKIISIWFFWIGVFLVLVVIGSIYYYYGTFSEEQNSKENVSSQKDYSDPMTKAAWIDKSQGTLRLPIDIAVQKVVEDYQR